MTGHQRDPFLSQQCCMSLPGRRQSQLLALWPKVTIKALTEPKMQKWPKIIFLRLSLKIIPVLWKAMFRLLLPGFAWFFVHFHKLIRPHPSPLWGGVLLFPFSLKGGIYLPHAYSAIASAQDLGVSLYKIVTSKGHIHMLTLEVEFLPTKICTEMAQLGKPPRR